MDISYIAEGLIEVGRETSKYLTIQPEVPMWMTLLGLGATALAAYVICKDIQKRKDDKESYKNFIF